MHKILVVDDEAISAVTLGEYLRDEGYDVRVATSGREGLQVGKEFWPDVLVSDWKLNDEVDGLELTQRLKAMNSDLYSILFSGLSAEDIGVEKLRSLVYRFLEKPCGIEEVVSTVREALSSRGRAA